MPRRHSRKVTIKEAHLDQISSKIYKVLLERFGEPIHDQPAMVGARDEGPGGKALWDDEPKKDRAWSDPNVVREADDGVCQQCGMMHSMEEDCTCGMAEADKTGYIPPASGSEMHFNEEDDLDEKTPSGGERVVKALKKKPKIDNPWAVAWSMKNKGAKFKKK